MLSDHTFTILLAGWLSYHRKEVALKGNATISAAGKKGSDQIKVEIKSLKEWAEVESESDPKNIFKNPDEFVKKWIVTGNAKLIRRKRVLPPEQPQSSISRETRR
ncbi:MAG: hypothetical protein KME42_24145 [Tildeniella nuda ZEHNDER 1965/U140]|jgi:hypothetical protein|nr:hypothetical protein [Tildeniella nuda ZEHNDER 1965/U140]